VRDEAAVAHHERGGPDAPFDADEQRTHRAAVADADVGDALAVDVARVRNTSTARCRSLISWTCSARSSALYRTGGPPRRANGASIAITTAPDRASCCA
jgi:hypothetical protein